MHKIYFLSGLGADERVFQHVKLNDAVTEHLSWLPPGKAEKVADYARRMVERIDKDQEVTLIGVSFGGIVAIEIAKLIPSARVMLISSVANRQELPSYYRIAGKLRLHRLVSRKMCTLVNTFTYYLFGVQKPAEQQLLKQIILDTDADFLRWALHEIVHWQHAGTISEVMQIHGTNDKILPLPRKRKAQLIEDGGHLMILSHAEEISKILNEQVLVGIK